MDACCETKAEELSALRDEHKKVLIIVLVINAVLFIVEAAAGLIAHSTALLADSLDMLGDALVYGFSLYVLWRSLKWKAVAAIVKGIIMAAFGIGVLAQGIHKMMLGIVPNAETMGIIGALVLLGNGICFLLLFRHRADDLNMRSTWLCSRNDIIANLAVLVAAAGVAFFASTWPDIIVGVAIATLFLKSAFTVLYESLEELRGLKATSWSNNLGMTRTKHRFNKFQPVDSDYGYYFCKHTYMPALRLPRTLRDADQILPIFL